jgi:hypothetical protein
MGFRKGGWGGGFRTTPGNFAQNNIIIKHNNMLNFQPDTFFINFPHYTLLPLNLESVIQIMTYSGKDGKQSSEVYIQTRGKRELPRNVKKVLDDIDKPQLDEL